MSTLWVLGATSAIAQATSNIFVEKGYDIVLIGRNETKLNQLAEHYRVTGASYVGVFVTELAQITEPDQLVAKIIDEHRFPDVVLLAQGDLPDQKKCEEDFTSAYQSLDVNLISPMALLGSIALEFERKKAGSMIVISSVAGDRGRQSNYIYGAAKGALTLFLSGLRNRLNPAGVQVLTVKPGFVDTPMTAHLDKKGLLWAKPEDIARSIWKGYEKGRNVVYAPIFWWVIMAIIKMIPESIFKRLKL